MWIISKPIKQDNEFTTIAYTYGEERWLDGFLIGSVLGSLVGSSMMYMAIRMFKRA